MRLSDEQMTNALAIFTGVVNDAITRVVDDPMRSKLTDYHHELSRLNAQFMFRPDIMGELMDTLLDDEDIRNHLFDVQFRFFAHAGTGPGFLESLCENLSDALMVDGPVRDWNTLPDGLKDSLPLAFLTGSEQSTSRFVRFLRRKFFRPSVTLPEFLLSNKHLITVLLFVLTPDDPASPPPQESK